LAFGHRQFLPVPPAQVLVPEFSMEQIWAEQPAVPQKLPPPVSMLQPAPEEPCFPHAGGTGNWLPVLRSNKRNNSAKSILRCSLRNFSELI
jgi:hypothetical protein